MLFLDVPLLRDADDYFGAYVALVGLGPSFTGAALYAGTSDGSLALQGGVSTPAVLGPTETALGGWLPNWIDETNTVTVNVGPGVLSSTTRAGIVGGTANICAIGAPGRWEIVQFIRAVSLGNGRYTLSGFKRGMYGTEANALLHQATDKFCLLNAGGLLKPHFQLADLNTSKRYRPVSTGAALASGTSESDTDTGQCLKPLRPYNLRGARAAGDLTLTWSRRTRYSENWLVGTMPLGETSEAYGVDIFTDNTFGTVKRTLASTTPTVVYSSAQQVADFGANQAAVYLRIYQISGSIGRGIPLQGTI